MGTKLYFTLETAPASPAYNLTSFWDDTSQAVRALITDSPSQDDTQILATVTETSGDSGWNVLNVQFVSPPLAAQTLSPSAAWALQAEYMACEGANAANAKPRWSVFVVKSDLSLRGTLSGGTSSGENDYPTSIADCEARYWADASVDEVVCSAGDRIVIEFGHSFGNTKTAEHEASLAYGYDQNDTDLTYPDNTTDDAAPYNTWVDLGGTVTFSTGDVTVPVGLPSGAGAALATVQNFDYVFSVGIPTGTGATLPPVVSGEAVVVVGLPAGAGAVLSTSVIGDALVAAGIPGGTGAPLSVSVIGNAVISAGIPAGAGVALPVTVVIGGDVVVVVGLPEGTGAALATTVIGDALIAAGLPAGAGFPLATVVIGDANVTVGLPSALAEALSTVVTGDALISLNAPSGAGVAIPVTVVVDGEAFTFYLFQSILDD
jgi:hypothetical protein